MDCENLKLYFGNGLMKLRIRCLDLLMLSDFRMSLSRQFDSLIAARKYLFWKKLCFVPNKGMLSDPGVGRDVFFQSIMLKRIRSIVFVYFEVIPGQAHYKVFLLKYHKCHLLYLTPHCIEVIPVCDGKKYFNFGRK